MQEKVKAEAKPEEEKKEEKTEDKKEEPKPPSAFRVVCGFALCGLCQEDSEIHLEHSRSFPPSLSLYIHTDMIYLSLCLS